MNKFSSTFLYRFLYLAFSLPLLCNAQITDMTIFKAKPTSKFYQEEFQRIGAYKVKGNSWILKGNNETDLYSAFGFSPDVAIVYDTYTQSIGILQDSRVDQIKLDNVEVDSFIVKADKDLNFSQPAFFINAEKFDGTKKGFLQRLTNGTKYNLYKSFKAEMRPAAMDLAQTNVKEFEIVSEYYYLDMKDKTTFIKIKPNTKALKDFFKDQKLALELLENESQKLEPRLISFFNKVNE